jgi:hypothetical protein
MAPPPKSKLPHKLSPMARLEVFASDEAKLSPPVRSYIKGIYSFHLALKDYRSQVPALKCFNPVQEYIQEVENSLDEGILLLLDFMGGEADFKDLQWHLQYDTASGLEGHLDSAPVLFVRLPAGIPDSVQDVLDDLETLAEQITEKIRADGYKLHTILIGAAFV